MAWLLLLKIDGLDFFLNGQSLNQHQIQIKKSLLASLMWKCLKKFHTCWSAQILKMKRGSMVHYVLYTGSCVKHGSMSHTCFRVSCIGRCVGWTIASCVKCVSMDQCVKNGSLFQNWGSMLKMGPWFKHGLFLSKIASLCQTWGNVPNFRNIHLWFKHLGRALNTALWVKGIQKDLKYGSVFVTRGFICLFVFCCIFHASNWAYEYLISRHLFLRMALVCEKLQSWPHRWGGGGRGRAEKVLEDRTGCKWRSQMGLTRRNGCLLPLVGDKAVRACVCLYVYIAS